MPCMSKKFTEPPWDCHKSINLGVFRVRKYSYALLIICYEVGDPQRYRWELNIYDNAGLHIQQRQFRTYQALRTHMQSVRPLNGGNTHAW